MKRLEVQSLSIDIHNKINKLTFINKKMQQVLLLKITTGFVSSSLLQNLSI